MIGAKKIGLITVQFLFIGYFGSIQEQKKEKNSGPDMIERCGDLLQWFNEDGQQEEGKEHQKCECKYNQAVDGVDFEKKSHACNVLSENNEKAGLSPRIE